MIKSLSEAETYGQTLGEIFHLPPEQEGALAPSLQDILMLGLNDTVCYLVNVLSKAHALCSCLFLSTQCGQFSFFDAGFNSSRQTKLFGLSMMTFLRKR